MSDSSSDAEAVVAELKSWWLSIWADERRPGPTTIHYATYHRGQRIVPQVDGQWPCVDVTLVEDEESTR